MFSLNHQAVDKDKALFYELLDYNMIYHGNSPIFTFALPGQKRLVEITYLEFGRAAHRIARYVRPDPFSGNENEVVSVLANVDNLAYHAITMGIVRSGLTVCPTIHILKYH
jgi:hypothetical protein